LTSCHIAAPSGQGHPQPQGTARLLEIHDVCPEHFDHVAGLVNRFARTAVRAVLAIIPGRPWQAKQIRQLQIWGDEGHELALHGYTHATGPLCTPVNRLHQAMFSRLAGENLGLSREVIVSRAHRGVAWFARHRLGAPRLYIPPAWVLGAALPEDFAKLGITVVERLLGFVDVKSGTLSAWPVVGFEADNAFRAVALKLWNAAAQMAGSPLGRYRVVVHPRDAQLRLRSSLEHHLRFDEYVSPQQLFAADPRTS
jgi:predicted deacetylase